MIHVIEHGNKEFTATCTKCGCQFTYEAEDLSEGLVGFVVKCPDCDNKIKHSETQPAPTLTYPPGVRSINNGCEGCYYYEHIKNGGLFTGDSPCTTCWKTKITCGG